MKAKKVNAVRAFAVVDSDNVIDVYHIISEHDERHQLLWGQKLVEVLITPASGKKAGGK